MKKRMLKYLRFSLSHEWSVVGERIFNALLKISQLQGITNINSEVQDEQMQRIKPIEKLKRKHNILSMIGHEHD
jgi:hypothetical protein